MLAMWEIDTVGEVEVESAADEIELALLLGPLAKVEGFGK